MGFEDLEILEREFDYSSKEEDLIEDKIEEALEDMLETMTPSEVREQVKELMDGEFQEIVETILADIE